MKSGLISIIMPVYNASKFLKDCLDSIINQSETHWELIAIDDFSDDDSADILAAYAECEPRIKWKSNTKKGIIWALRNALLESQGEYISRMDADDLMPPDKLQLLKAELTKNGTGHLATGHVAYFSSTVLGQGYLRYQNWLNQLCVNQNHYTNIYKECVIPSPCWMMYRTDLIKIGSFESDSYPEDYDLCFRMYQHHIKVMPSQEILHQWRDHPNRASRNDPNYLDNRFFDIKLKYFLALDYNPNRRLILLGAGRKAKYIASRWAIEGIDFGWYCNNQKKIGHHIYGVQIQDDKELLNQLEDNLQIVIVISNPEDQAQIRSQLEEAVLQEGKQFYFWC